jgi:hypothetical protein
MTEPVNTTEAGDPQQSTSGDPNQTPQISIEQALAQLEASKAEIAKLTKSLKEANAEAAQRRLANKDAAGTVEALQAQIAELNGKFEASEKRAAREAALVRIIGEVNLPPALSKFLVGDNYESLLANAQELMTAIPQPTTTAQPPRPSVGNNAAPQILTREMLNAMTPQEVQQKMKESPELVEAALKN